MQLVLPTRRVRLPRWSMAQQMRKPRRKTGSSNGVAAKVRRESKGTCKPRKSITPLTLSIHGIFEEILAERCPRVAILLRRSSPQGVEVFGHGKNTNPKKHSNIPQMSLTERKVVGSSEQYIDTTVSALFVSFRLLAKVLKYSVKGQPI